jgi:hypothetical protein
VQTILRGVARSAKLGAEDFEEARAEGQAMTFQQAVEYAFLVMSLL